MPFGPLARRRPKHSEYGDLERTPFPLSAQDDDGDDDERNGGEGGPDALPPYSDAPPRKRYSDLPSDEEGGGGGGVGPDGYDERNGAGPPRSKRPRYRGGILCGCLKRWLGCLFFAFLVVVIALCAAGIGYIVAQDGSPFKADDEPSDSEGGDGKGTLVHIGGGKIFQAGKAKGDGGGDDGNLGGILPPPPPDLHETCTDWITKSGREKCRAECDVAKCCALPATDTASCWWGRATDCATYRAACMALELHDAEGSDESANNNMGAGGGGDLDEDDGTAYGGLLEGTTHLTAPKFWELEQKCSADSLKTPDGFDACSALCRPSRCCDPATYGCDVSPEDRQWCTGYEVPCAGVVESWRGSGHAVAAPPPAPADVSNGSDPQQQRPAGQDTVSNPVILACNSANLNPPTECLEACAPGACCYKSLSYPPIEQLFAAKYGANSPMHSVSSCANNVGFCQQFGACEHLNHLKDESSSPGYHGPDAIYQLDLSKVCQPEHVAQFGALECSNVCQPAHCCFSGEYECETVGLGHLECGDYVACGVLYPDYKSPGDLLKMARDIDEACAEDSLGSGKGRSRCQFLCRDRLCCFEEGAYGCADNADMNCIAYAGCETLVSTPLDYVIGGDDEAKEPENAENSAGGDVDAEVDAFIVSLEAACSETSLMTLEGIQKCHNKCQTHLCCFTSDSTLAGGSCENMHVEACGAYKPCERLVTPTEKNPLVAEKGSESGTSTGTPPPSPLDLDELALKVERACELPSDPYSITQEWVTTCHNVCAERLCCLVDARIGSNCRATVGRRECDAYGPCEVLINEESGKEITTAEGAEEKFADIETMCNDGVDQSDAMYNACEERCEQRSCCFEEEPTYSCYIMENEWCDEFSACSFVDFIFPAAPSVPSGGEMGVVGTENSVPASEPGSTSSTFLETCGGSKYRQNWDKCLDLCTPYECCFDEGGDPCDDDPPEGCEYYSACEDLFLAQKEDINWQTGKIDDAPTARGSTSNESKPAPNFSPFEAAMENACSEESLMTVDGVRECYNRCQVHLCCVPADAMEAEYDCSDTRSEECNAYGVCERLVSLYDLWKPPSKATDPNAVRTAVKDVCTLPKDGRKAVTAEWISKCHQVCQARLCCLTDSSHGGCVDFLGEDECRDYAACEVLIMDGVDESDVDDVCNDEVSSNKERFMDCRETCKERSCCFEEQRTYSCYHMEKDWCDEFESCELVGYSFLDSDTTETNQAEIEVDFEGIDAKCSKEYLLAFGMDECEYLCQPMKCCFGASCSSYPNESNCERAVACENFFSPHSDDLILEKICSEEELEVNETPCQDSCKPYECCFNESPCSAHIEPVCHNHEPCRYWFQTYNNDITLDQDPNPDSFKSLCSGDKIQENWDACGKHCAGFECCFKEENSCYDEKTEECIEYSICEGFFYEKEQAEEEAASEIDSGNESSGSGASNSTTPYGMQQSFKTLCSTSALQKNWDACKSHCSRFECCFLQENSCYQERSLECDEYSICEEFFFEEEHEEIANEATGVPSGSPDSNQEQEPFKTLCTQSNLRQNWDTCQRKCAPYECCFKSSDSGDCYQSRSTECDQYYICEEFLDKEEQDYVQETFKDLCTPSTIGQNWDACKERCKPFECCFRSENSCYADDHLECDAYYICEEFYNDSNSGIDTADNISAKPGSSAATPNFGSLEAMKYRCSRSHLEQNLDDCGKWCAPYECCFYLSKSCYTSNKQECDNHNVCESVFAALRIEADHNNAALPSTGAGAAPTSSATGSAGTNNAMATDEGLSETQLLILARACNSDQLRINGDSECMMLCQGSACCFDQYSPCNEKAQFCQDHAICSSMFT